MQQAADIHVRLGQWSPRARSYALALVTTLGYWMIGRASNVDPHWGQIYLPLSAVSVLLLGLSAAEVYIYIHRLQQSQAELQAARGREIDLSQRLALQRQTILNTISRNLIDKLDINQMPREVLENIALLFAANVVTLWQTDKATAKIVLKGGFGLHNHTDEQLAAIHWAFPRFEDPVTRVRQIVLDSGQQRLPAALAEFCQTERIVSSALIPIVRRHELVGAIGIFYRQALNISPSLAAEMQSVANIIASAIQAEELYRDLIQVQKIESIGTLTSGIAHDFNNVLAAILACAGYVKQHTDPASPTFRYLQATEESAHRGAALTKQLLSFARREGPRATVLNANGCIEQTLKMVERSFEKSFLIQRQFADDLHLIEADPSQLEQVILNIAVNARDAMPNGGIFTVSTRNACLDVANPPRPNLRLPDGDYVVLGFRDMGNGMDTATLKRIFEPFFTTKAPGRGTGLGLSVVKSVVQSFGGEIRVQSAPGNGTLFEVFLPTTDKPLPETVAPKASAAPGGGECILLAEDEEVIREMAQLGLEAKGYKVITAPDGASALGLYREQWQQIDLVIADMVMPLMSGSELFARMKEINPNVRVIVSSGYSHDLEGQRMLQHGCLGYLQKPYTTESLSQLVRNILDSGL